MPTSIKPTKTATATKKVVEILTLIVNGPRFTRHLENAVADAGLAKTSTKSILKAAFKSL